VPDEYERPYFAALWSQAGGQFAPHFAGSGFVTTLAPGSRDAHGHFQLARLHRWKVPAGVF